MKTLKKIDVMSAAKFMAVMYAIISLIMAIFAALFANMLGGFAGSMMMQGGMGYEANMMQGAVGGFSLGALIMAPIMGAIGGFIGGAIGAWIYNLVAGWMGGIKLELE
ncbi:MAG: hypothetical protein PHU71_00665 [Candidatus Gracilibacteria bacterium]|nr:hypothetical protein [Candidatus Gracilibacteria bacterium]